MEEECQPIRTIDELLNFQESPVSWNILVHPLATRCKPRFLGKDFASLTTFETPTEIDDRNRPETIIFHDFAGNYRGDRFINGAVKWDDYRFYNWSGIDYFCYFSHEFVTIPTLQYINAAHDNGCKMLGTFIVENEDGRERLETILESDHFMRRCAESLIFITKHCKFEGWLINIEVSLSIDKILMLKKFVEYLTNRTRQEIQNGKIIWYDSIIKNGSLIWQNELNENNELFFNACDGILINYWWGDAQLENSARIATSKGRMKDVYFGIDVFGRNQLGGFDTNVTLARIKKYDFSVGLYAVGWTFETMTELGIDIESPMGNELCNRTFLERNDLFYTLLWDNFYTFGPNQLPFYTSFCIGSGTKQFENGSLSSEMAWYNLSEQYWQSSVPTKYLRYFEDCVNGGSCIQIFPTSTNIRLFISDFSMDNGIILGYAFKRSTPDVDISLIIHSVDQNTNNSSKYICSGNNNNINKTLFNKQVNEKLIERYMKPLNTDSKYLKDLYLRGDKIFSKRLIAMGWETRYYYFNTVEEEIYSSKIVDIGAVVNSHSNTQTDYVLLGAINIYNGFENKHQTETFKQTIKNNDIINSMM